MRTRAGFRNLAYCEAHAENYAQSQGLRMPRKDNEDARAVNLKAFTSSALKVLEGRIKEELIRREELPSDVVFEFDETSRTPVFVARVYYNKEGELKHFFFGNTIKRVPLPDGRTRVHGEYAVRPGSIIKKRFGEDQEKTHRLYLLTPEGEEVLVAMPGDDERQGLVRAYLKGEIGMDALLEKEDGPETADCD